MKPSKIFVLFIFIILFCMPAFSKENKFKVKVGDTFKIELESNATTGYQWQLAKSLNEKIVKLVSSKYILPSSNLVGAGGTEVWTFKGIKEGKTKISLKYVRPWEKAKPVYLKIYAIEVK